MATIASHHPAHPQLLLSTRPRTTASHLLLHQTTLLSLNSHSTTSLILPVTMSASQKVHLAPINRARQPLTTFCLMVLLHISHRHHLPEHQLISLHTPISNHHHRYHSTPRTIPAATHSRALRATLHNIVPFMSKSNIVTSPWPPRVPHDPSTVLHPVQPH